MVVNLKTYPQTLGPRAVALSRAALRLERRTGIGIAVCPQAIDLRACVATGARVYAQHFDFTAKPEATGWQSVEALMEAGCEGSLINHSEHPVTRADLDWFVGAARDAGLVSILCTRDEDESERFAAFRPSLVAVEPPQLIGGDISVTTAEPDIVRRSVAAVRRAAAGVPVLCGAGVKTAADVAKAVELGAHGVLVASGVAKAPKPAQALEALLGGFPASAGRARK